VDQVIADVLQATRVIAVLGAHVERSRPAFFVPDYLSDRGYRVLPVNPSFVGRTQCGEPFRASLADLDTPVDLVDVFRHSAVVGEHLRELLDLSPRPGTVWLQVGVRDDTLAARLEEVGIRVIQDRCLMTDHAEWARAGMEGRRPIDS
jgi:predicted CoA-binding protein